MVYLCLFNGKTWATMDDYWSYHHFRKPLYLSIYIYILYPVQKATCVSTFDGQHIYIFSSTDVKVINLQNQSIYIYIIYTYYGGGSTPIVPICWGNKHPLSSYDLLGTANRSQAAAKRDSSQQKRDSAGTPESLDHLLKPMVTWGYHMTWLKKPPIYIYTSIDYW